MSAYGQIRAGSLLLYDQTIQANDVDLGDLKFTNLSISGTSTLRTNRKTCLVSYHHAYGKEDMINNELITANATSVLTTSDAHVALNITGANGRAVRQTIAYLPHSIGGGTIAYLGAVLSTSSPSQPSNIRARIGLFDDTIDTGSSGNGFFFQLFGGALSVVHRTSTSGSSQTDNTVARASFSDDMLDGTGASGFTFSPSVFNVFFVDMTFAGSGVVRMGVLFKGAAIFAHTFTFNTASTPFIRYPTLPVRFEIQNTTTSTQTDTMRISSASVWSEGRIASPRSFPVTTGTTAISVTTSRRPLVSIRVRTSTIRAIAFLRRLNILTDRACLVEVLHNTAVTGALWTQAGSFCEVDTAGTAITGGRLVQATTVDKSMTISMEPEIENVITASTIAGSASFILSIVASNIDAQSLVIACATIEEQY